MKRWRHEDKRLVADMRIFRAYRATACSPRTGSQHPISLLEAVDWVNVIALTPRRDVVLVRQFRHGMRAFTLEIPGGQVDAGETPIQAAARELREETGFAGGRPILLGTVTPNPAFLNNRCHTVLFRNCRPVGRPELDRGEDIEVLLHPLADIPEIVRSGGIHHALVICAFWWLAQRCPALGLLPHRTGTAGPEKGKQ